MFLGCVSTKISPRTGLGAAHRVRRDGPLPGWFFLDKNFGGSKVKFVKRKILKRGPSVAPDIERGFKQLMKSQDWRRLAKMPGVADAFNVFQVLDDAVCENSWSSILAVLFSSSSGHGLDMRPLRLWLSEIGDSRFNVLAKRAASSSVLREWGTMERRRLDILIKLLDARDTCLGSSESKTRSGAASSITS